MPYTANFGRFPFPARVLGIFHKKEDAMVRIEDEAERSLFRKELPEIDCTQLHYIDDCGIDSLCGAVYPVEIQ